MSEIRATVVALDGEHALVQAEKGGCGRCHEKGGCGGQHLTQMLCASDKTWRVPNPAGVQVGQAVTLKIAEGALRQSANLAYALPVLALIAGAMLGKQGYGDAGALIGAGLGLLLSWWHLRRRAASVVAKTTIDPQILPRS